MSTDASAEELAREKEEETEKAQQEMKELEEADELPSDLSEWPGGAAKYETYGSDDDAYGEGATAKLGPADLKRRKDDWAANLASKSPLLMRMGKDAMFRQQDMAFMDALDYLRGNLSMALSTEDVVEGVTAFMEKREPNWKGK